jgi:hypothetical protein
LKDTLEQTKLNNELISYIQNKLTNLNIDYNQGFILKLSIQEKIQLKEKIDSIGLKNDEMKDNT